MYVRAINDRFGVVESTCLGSLFRESDLNLRRSNEVHVMRAIKSVRRIMCWTDYKLTSECVRIRYVRQVDQLSK